MSSQQLQQQQQQNQQQTHHRENQPSHLEIPRTQDSELTNLIETKLSRGDFPIIFLAMHNGFYWHRELLCHPNVETALIDLRRCLYDLILPPAAEDGSPVCVSEYFRDENDELQRRDVAPMKRFPSIILLANATQEKRFALFSDIFLIEEKEEGRNQSLTVRLSSLNYEKRFVVLILRFFFRITRRSVFPLDARESNAVVASVCHSLSRHGPMKDSIPQTIVVPSYRCLSAFNWLQEVYLYGFNLIGRALGLHALFPHPRDLFQGSVFVRYFAQGVDDVRSLFPEHETVVNLIFA